MSQFGTFDNRSDRRDLLTLLAALDRGVSPREGDARRSRFLAHVGKRFGLSPQGSQRGQPTEVYFVLVALAAQYRFDLNAVAIELENIVRKL